MTANLHWQTCTVCGTPFLGLQRKIGVNVFCSPACANVAKRSYMRNIRGVPLERFTPSPLNKAVDKAYARCVARGTHRPGATLTGSRSWRGYDVQMPVCDGCGVPLPDESVGFRLAGSAA